MTFRWLILGLMLVARGAADEQADRIALIHVAAIGGEDRLEAFTSLKASGLISISNQTLQTTIVAQQPNRVWIETRGLGVFSVQGYDGKDQPWQFIESGHTKTISVMDAVASREFIADADFYDPLYHSAQRGYKLAYLSPITVDGKTYERVRVTHAEQEPQDLWLDPDTFFIVRQIRNRKLVDGREIPIETRFSDFRPAGGVLTAFRITSYAAGRKLHETELESVEANPTVNPGIFDLPGNTAPAQPPDSAAPAK